MADLALEELRYQWAQLSEFVEPGTAGWTRRVFSAAYKEERSWLAEQFRSAGCSYVDRDAAGNLVGVVSGKYIGMPPLVIGSHTDTVDGGGRFDGIVGVLGALEVVRQLRESGRSLNRDLYVYDFFGEEVGDFGIGCLGSKALVGDLDTTDLNRISDSGQRLGDAFATYGLEPGHSFIDPGPRRWKSYLELHIEQATSLELAGTQIGVVTAIAGIRRLVAHFSGEQNHAGGARMDERKDALIAAARAAVIIHETACVSTDYAVGTTTRIENESSALNVVPSQVRMRSEIRSTENLWLDTAQQDIARGIQAITKREGIETSLDWVLDNPVTDCDASLQDQIVRACEDVGASWAGIPSGATHDAAHIAEACPTAMIFVPSVAGKSHCPEELTEWSDIKMGIDVLYRTVRMTDSELAEGEQYS